MCHLERKELEKPFERQTPDRPAPPIQRNGLDHVKELAETEWTQNGRKLAISCSERMCTVRLCSTCPIVTSVACKIDVASNNRTKLARRCELIESSCCMMASPA